VQGEAGRGVGGGVVLVGVGRGGIVAIIVSIGSVGVLRVVTVTFTLIIVTVDIVTPSIIVTPILQPSPPASIHIHIPLALMVAHLSISQYLMMLIHIGIATVRRIGYIVLIILPVILTLIRTVRIISPTYVIIVTPLHTPLILLPAIVHQTRYLVTRHVVVIVLDGNVVTGDDVIVLVQFLAHVVT